MLRYGTRWKKVWGFGYLPNLMNPSNSCQDISQSQNCQLNGGARERLRGHQSHEDLYYWNSSTTLTPLYLWWYSLHARQQQLQSDQQSNSCWDSSFKTIKVNQGCGRGKKSRDHQSLGLISWGTWMSLQNWMAVHPVFVKHLNKLSVFLKIFYSSRDQSSGLAVSWYKCQIKVSCCNVLNSDIFCICIDIYILSHIRFRFTFTCVSVLEALSNLKSTTDMIWCCLHCLQLPVKCISNMLHRGISSLLSNVLMHFLCLDHLKLQKSLCSVKSILYHLPELRRP